MAAVTAAGVNAARAAKEKELNEIATNDELATSVAGKIFQDIETKFKEYEDPWTRKPTSQKPHEFKYILDWKQSDDIFSDVKVKLPDYKEGADETKINGIISGFLENTQGKLNTIMETFCDKTDWKYRVSVKVDVHSDNAFALFCEVWDQPPTKPLSMESAKKAAATFFTAITPPVITNVVTGFISLVTNGRGGAAATDAAEDGDDKSDGADGGRDRAGSSAGGDDDAAAAAAAVAAGGGDGDKKTAAAGGDSGGDAPAAAAAADDAQSDGN